MPVPALTFETSFAQNRSDSNDTTNGDTRQRLSSSTSSEKTGSADDYSLLVWDPVAKAWVSADRRSQNQQARRAGNQQARQDRQQTRISRDRRPDTQEWSETMEGRSGDGREADDNQAERDRSPIRLAGTIDGFRKVNLQRGENMPEEHTWIRIRLKDGASRVVDLGRKKELDELNLKQGKRIRVSGREGSVSGQEVLLADTIRVGNETYNIDRETRRQQVIGTISDYERVRLEGSDRAEHLVVRLELESGKEVTADLGRSGSLSELQLYRDKPVELEGELRRIDGRSILVVRKITHVGAQR